MRAIFQNKAVPIYKNFFSKNFCLVCDRLVSLNMGSFSWGEKRTNADEKRIMCKPTITCLDFGITTTVVALFCSVVVSENQTLSRDSIMRLPRNNS